MSTVLMTMAEDVTKTSTSNFGLRYPVDEHDCLHFAQSLKELGHQVYFVNWMDLGVVEFERMFNYNDTKFVRPLQIRDMDLIFVYKMEGFYGDLARFDTMLDRFAQTNVINDIATIRHNLDKSYLWQLSEKGIRTIPSYRIHELSDRLAGGERFVIKPLKGERGKGIFLAETRAALEPVIGQEDQYFAQEFMSSIRNGERSLVFLGHEYQHAVIKHPSPTDQEEFRCNESLGGTVAIYEPDAEEIAFCQNVLKVYEDLGYPVHFSRIDLISSEAGPVLLEAELLNPSIYANYSDKGKQYGDRIAKYFEQFMCVNQKAKML